MFGVIAAYAGAAWRWPALRQERALIYGLAPGLLGAAFGFAALFAGEWAALLTSYPWSLLGLMLLYAVGAGLVIGRERRAALFVLLWGLFAFAPAAYRVYDWSGKFFYLPQTFWALAGALLLDALIALALRNRRAIGEAT